MSARHYAVSEEQVHEQHHAEEAQLRADYDRAVGKFDDVRAALARRVEADTGQPAHPPDEDDRPWHEWLIEKSDAALNGKLTPGGGA